MAWPTETLRKTRFLC